MVALVVFVVWILIPASLVYVAVRRRAGRARLRWLGAAGVYVVLFMVAPYCLVTYPRGGGEGTPAVQCTAPDGRPIACP